MGCFVHAWGVLSAFKKTCGGFCPPITKWTWGVMSVGCFVRIPHYMYMDFFFKIKQNNLGNFERTTRAYSMPWFPGSEIVGLFSWSYENNILT